MDSCERSKSPNAEKLIDLASKGQCAFLAADAFGLQHVNVDHGEALSACERVPHEINFVDAVEMILKIPVGQGSFLPAIVKRDEIGFAGTEDFFFAPGERV